MPNFKKPIRNTGFGFPKAVQAAYGRRLARAGGREQQIEWFIDEVVDKIALTMRQRVGIATELVRSKVVRNISIPVGRSPEGRVVLRSKPGEYPRADTTQLMKTIFGVVVSGKGFSEGYVGTPIDYGVILELRMQRSFLVRTLNEQRGRVMRILTGPIK